MSPQASRFLVGTVACAALCAPAPASAGEVLSVDGGRVTRIEDPFVPEGTASDLGRAPRPRRAPTTRGARAGAARSRAVAARSKGRKGRGPTRGQKAVGRTLTGALRAGRISRSELKRYRRLYDRSRSTRKKLRGARGREYHELLRELLSSLCDRVRTPVYCDTARSFRRYATEPAELVLLGPASVVKDQATRVSFAVSKLSAVQLTITRDGRTALDKVVTFRRGAGSFGWTPKSAGTYSVGLASKELRTGRGLRTRVSGAIESLGE